MSGNMIKPLRKDLGITQEELATRLRTEYGLKTDRATVGKWEIGAQTPEMYTLICLSKLFGVSLDTFNSSDDTQSPSQSPSIPPLSKSDKVAMLGTISCVDSMLVDENIDSYINVPEEIDCNFTLRCKGDSMINVHIYDGDIVYIHQQITVENGEIAAVLIDGEDAEAILKRVYTSKNQIMLISENSTYQPKVYIGEDRNKVHILGKVVAFTSTIR